MLRRTIQKIPVTEFKVGDIFWHLGEYEMRVIGVLSPFVVNGREGDNPKFDLGYDFVRDFVYFYPDTFWCLQMRNCNPCYDSDCDCIYDSIMDDS